MHAFKRPCKVTSSLTGYTLIELLCVLALFSVILILVLPTDAHYLESIRLEASAKRLLSALQFARQLAIREHCVVSFCKSHDKIHCGGDWEQGWLLFRGSSNTPTALPPGHSNRLLRYYPALDKPQTMRWRGALNIEHLQFNPRGIMMVRNGRFVLCNRSPRSQTAWVIYLNQAGRARLEQSNDVLLCKQS
jgi:type IV fimbrial biogenesis protein FimT